MTLFIIINIGNSLIHRPLIPIILTSALAATAVCAQEVITLEKIQVEEKGIALEERHESSIAKRIISGEELTQYGDLNALEILKRTPGVTIPEGKGKKSAPGKGYTVVLIDGEEVSTGSKRSTSPLEQISPDRIERIEVMTNGSAEYTAESMGGIVNIILKKPKSQGATTAKVMVGAYGDTPMESLFAQREGKLGKISYLINVNASDSRKKDTSSTSKQSAVSAGDEFRDDTSYDRFLNLTGKLIFAASSKDKYTFDGSVAMNDTKVDTDAKMIMSPPAALSRLLNNSDRSKGTMLWAKMKGEHHLSGTELLEWKFKFHQSADDGEGGSFQSLPTSSVRTQQDKSLFRVLGAEGIYSLAMGEHFIKTGLELKGQSQRDEVKRSIDGIDVTAATDNVSMRQNKGSLYLQDEFSLSDTMVVTPGLRYEMYSRNYGNTSHIGYVAPSLHLLVKLTPNDNLRASVAKTVKLPRLDELSTSINSSLERNDVHHPDLTGNPDLREEKALSYELRLEHFLEDKGLVSFGGFYRNIDDKIEKMTLLDGTRYVMRPYNSGQGNLWGIEVELKKPLNTYVDGLGLFANATFQNSSLTNTHTGLKRPIKQTSNLLYNLGFDHTLKVYSFTYGGAYRYAGGYNDPVDENAIAQSQKGYGSLDVYASKRLDKTFKLQLNLKNITRRTIETSSNLYGINEMQIDKEHSKPQILLTLEGKW